jgi:hypothetical protein
VRFLGSWRAAAGGCRKGSVKLRSQPALSQSASSQSNSRHDPLLERMGATGMIEGLASFSRPSTIARTFDRNPTDIDNDQAAAWPLRFSSSCLRAALCPSPEHHHTEWSSQRIRWKHAVKFDRCLDRNSIEFRVHHSKRSGNQPDSARGGLWS